MNCRWVVCLLAVSVMLDAKSTQGQSYSVDASGFTTAPVISGGGGAFPDDVFFLTPALPPVLPIPSLALLGAGPAIEVDGLSYGRPLGHFSSSAPSHFSVDFAAISVVGTASGIEFSNPAGSEASSDVFVSSYTSTNTLVYDGNGVATPTNPAVPGLALAEPATQPPPGPPDPFLPRFDDLDGLDLRSPSLIAGPASPTGVVYFSIDAVSAAGGVYGAVSPGDVFVGDGSGIGPIYDAPAAGFGTLPAAPGGVPQPYALEGLLGFPIPGNDIDALVVYDNGDGFYTPGLDIIVFSLAPGSSYLGMTDPLSGLAVEPSDILVDGGTAVSLLGGAAPLPAVLHSGESLGLVTGRSSLGVQIDNLNALDLVIPEPSSFCLAGLTMLALVCHRRRSSGAQGSL